MSNSDDQSYRFQLQCQCGDFKAAISVPRSEKLSHLTCYCEDCQKAARHIGAESTLDEHGGTDIVQVSPASITLPNGADNLSCVMVTEKGPTRWYTTCCQSPICNTVPKRNFPYVGLVHKTAMSKDENKRFVEFVGPPVFGVNAGKLHPLKKPFPVFKGFGFRGLITTVRSVLRWRFRGDGKHNPFLNELDKPIVKPERLA